jgi:hypothetical protein
MNTNFKIKCKVCDITFDSSLPFTKYCTNCKNKGRRRIKICKRCNEEFLGYRTAKYCSIKCGALKYDYNIKEIISLFNDKKSPTEISNMLNLTYSTVISLMHKNNLKFNNRKLNIELTEEQKQILNGAILGDATISRTSSNNCRMRFVHGPKQYKYLKWKYGKLKTIINTKPKIYEYDERMYGKECMNFTTMVNEYINNIHRELYINNIKSPNLNFLNKLNDISVAIWFFDDGYFGKCGGSLSTQGFSTEHTELISEWLSDKFNTKKPRLQLHSSCNKYYIVINKELIDNILNYIHDYAINIPGMNYKLKYYK